MGKIKIKLKIHSVEKRKMKQLGGESKRCRCRSGCSAYTLVAVQTTFLTSIGGAYFHKHSAVQIMHHLHVKILA